MTTFEDFSNKVIYEIFDFLNFYDAFETFYGLNIRFQNLFLYSNFPISINILSVSKSTFQRFLTHIIIPQTYRITSLRLSNPFATDMYLLLIVPIITKFIRLEALTLNSIEASHIKQVLDHLSSIPVLSSLTIASRGYRHSEIPILRYSR